METYFTKISKSSAEELSFLTQLDHPNIAHAVSVESLAGEGCVITMEDIGGVTLWDFVDEHGTLAAADVRYIGQKLCRAVEYLHGLTPPWLYCDMKPENILVTGGPENIEQVVLIDIDGGCPMDLNGLPPEESYGTVGYAAPEQQHPVAPLDFRVDVYGICATMDAILRRHQLLSAPHEKGLLRVIERGMSEALGDRYFTVIELRKALEAT